MIRLGKGGNDEATTNTTLTADDLHRIDEVAPKGSVLGDRYLAQAMTTVNR